ncbi:MAG: hypothetical protein HY891_06905 [Deltaproteobacteria bacterium]|nr:hypothetical protein [Deltaproteobacteria bacterium]
MKKMHVLILTAFLALSPVLSEGAQREFRSGVKSLSRKQLIELAMSAAPAHISRRAAVMIQGSDGKFEVVKKGSNEFTCVPDIDGQETPSPMCADKAAMQFFMDMWSGKEKPANTTVGVAYMAKGGWHWEKGKKVIMSMDKGSPGAKRVREPAHWMIISPFDPDKTMLPTTPGVFGSWIMFDKTPFAHLMVYQDPMELSQEHDTTDNPDEQD